MFDDPAFNHLLTALGFAGSVISLAVICYRMKIL